MKNQDGNFCFVIKSDLVDIFVDQIYDVCFGIWVWGMLEYLLDQGIKIDNVWGFWWWIVYVWVSDLEFCFEGVIGGVLSVFVCYFLILGWVFFIL